MSKIKITEIYLGEDKDYYKKIVDLFKEELKVLPQLRERLDEFDSEIWYDKNDSVETVRVKSHIIKQELDDFGVEINHSFVPSSKKKYLLKCEFIYKGERLVFEGFGIKFGNDIAEKSDVFYDVFMKILLLCLSGALDELKEDE